MVCKNTPKKFLTGLAMPLICPHSFLMGTKCCLQHFSLLQLINFIPRGRLVWEAITGPRPFSKLPWQSGNSNLHHPNPTVHFTQHTIFHTATKCNLCSSLQPCSYLFEILKQENPRREWFQLGNFQWHVDPTSNNSVSLQLEFNLVPWFVCNTTLHVFLWMEILRTKLESILSPGLLPLEWLPYSSYPGFWLLKTTSSIPQSRQGLASAICVQ